MKSSAVGWPIEPAALQGVRPVKPRHTHRVAPGGGGRVRGRLAPPPPQLNIPQEVSYRGVVPQLIGGDDSPATHIRLERLNDL